MAAFPNPNTSRLALAAVAASAALGLTRVFEGSAWIVPVLVAAFVPPALLAWSQRRDWAAGPTLAAVVAAGILFTMLVAEPQTTFFGAPTTETLARFADDLGLAPDVLRTATLPVAPQGASLVLAVLATWMLATVADWTATRLDGTLSALVPGLVLFASIAALGDGVSGLSTALFALSCTAFLLASHGEGLESRRTWFRAPNGRPSRLLAGGALAGTVAVAAGFLVGPRLPGAGSEPILDYRELGDGTGGGELRTVNPLVEVQSRLQLDPPVELFMVRSSDDRPAYWRLVGLDQFDGEAWDLGPQTRATRADERLGGDASAGDLPLEQEYLLTALESAWIPAAYAAVGTNVADARVIEDTTSLLVEEPLETGTSYLVSSVPPSATPEDLQRASDFERESPGSFANLGRYLALPDDFSPRVEALARAATRGATNGYDAAYALQQFLRTEFVYDTDVELTSSERAMEEFLFEVRRGFCEQFSASFAAMARSVGLPARVAVGFTPGTYDDSAGAFRVTSRDAHAWPEVWFPEYGWVPFEPTPGRFEPSPGDPSRTGSAAPGRTEPTPPTSAPTATTAPGDLAPTTLPPFEDAGGDTGAGGAGTDPSVWETVRGVVVLALGVAAGGVAVLVAAVLAAKAHRRRRRRRGDDRERVHGAWHEALDRLGEAGITPRPSATPVEFAMRQAPADGVGEGGPPLMRLAQLETEAAYAAQPPGDEAATEAWIQVEGLGQALRRSTPLGERWRRRLDPRALRTKPPVTTGVAAVDSDSESDRDSDAAAARSLS